ncbi:MAG TPA: YtxH domain-containing protein [Longimicrobiales bacterium]
MYYRDESHTAYFLGGMAIGLLLGAGIAMLTAPQTGRSTRRRLKNSLSGAVGSLGDGWDELGDEIRAAVDKGRRRLNL